MFCINSCRHGFVLGSLLISMSLWPGLSDFDIGTIKKLAGAQWSIEYKGKPNTFALLKVDSKFVVVKICENFNNSSYSVITGVNGNSYAGKMACYSDLYHLSKEDKKKKE